jgi:hypothetical protein
VYEERSEFQRSVIIAITLLYVTKQTLPTTDPSRVGYEITRAWVQGHTEKFGDLGKI